VSAEGQSALAFDFGKRRIGVALAQPEVQLASALGVIAARDGDPDWQQLDRLVKEWAPARLIVGVPCEPDGSHGASAAPALAFAERLGARYGLPLALIDERLTSHAAEAMLREQRQSGLRQRRIRSGQVDSLSARLIAESWLSQQGPRQHGN